MLSPSRGEVGLANHGNIIVRSVPRVGILIVNDVHRVVILIVREQDLKDI